MGRREVVADDSERNHTMTSRRLALAGVSTLALAACANTGSATSSVKTVLMQVQFVLPLLDALAAGIAVAVPSAAPAIAAAQPYIASANQVFQTLSDTMTATQAQPLVDQIVGYINGALTAVSGVVQGNPKLAPLATQVSQARAVLALLAAFAKGVQTMPTGAAAPVPLLHR